MSYPQDPAGGYPHGAVPPVGAARRRPGVVLAGAIMTYIGGGMVLGVGVWMLLLGTGNGGFGIENVSVPVEAMTAVGGVCMAVGVLLVVLAVLTQRGHDAARIGLTALGALFVIGHLYEVTTGNLVPLIGVAWIAVAVLLLWVGRATSWFRAARAERGVGVK